MSKYRNINNKGLFYQSQTTLAQSSKAIYLRQTQQQMPKFQLNGTTACNYGYLIDRKVDQANNQTKNIVSSNSNQKYTMNYEQTPQTPIRQFSSVIKEPAVTAFSNCPENEMSFSQEQQVTQRRNKSCQNQFKDNEALVKQLTERISVLIAEINKLSATVEQQIEENNK